MPKFIEKLDQIESIPEVRSIIWSEDHFLGEVEKIKNSSDESYLKERILKAQKRIESLASFRKKTTTPQAKKLLLCDDKPRGKIFYDIIQQAISRKRDNENHIQWKAKERLKEIKKKKIIHTKDVASKMKDLIETLKEKGLDKEVFDKISDKIDSLSSEIASFDGKEQIAAFKKFSKSIDQI